MNYYNPYFSTLPYSYAPTMSASRGLLGGLLSGGKLSTIINGTQKTLGIVNQAIPIVKQMSPVMKNAKTMFRVMNEFKRIDKPLNNNTKSFQTKSNNEDKLVKEDVLKDSKKDSDNIGPTFFL